VKGVRVKKTMGWANLAGPEGGRGSCWIEREVSLEGQEERVSRKGS